MKKVKKIIHWRLLKNGLVIESSNNKKTIVNKYIKLSTNNTSFNIKYTVEKRITIKYE